ncbi:hypothetical protein MHYP_G00147720 [Metynnis hypsauchen]
MNRGEEGDGGLFTQLHAVLEGHRGGSASLCETKSSITGSSAVLFSIWISASHREDLKEPLHSFIYLHQHRALALRRLTPPPSPPSLRASLSWARRAALWLQEVRRPIHGRSWCSLEEQYVAEGTEEPKALPPHAAYRDAETITDVCNSTDLPEVEIISLLEEKLPVYRLRADCVYGYDHDDWLHTPLISPDTRIDLTTEQIEETLNYFLLCAERVGQMTKTYNDIDAITRLLEEKERDLELAARIGQSLLKRNRALCEQNEYLEEQVGTIKEEVAQLHHELNLKDELLQFYTNAAEESEEEAASPSSSGQRSRVVGTISSGSSLDVLQKKLRDLEEENISLRSEVQTQNQ